MKTYVCSICGYVYDEAAGIPGSGIALGTRWENLPGDWVCPWCGAPKAMFREPAPAPAQKAKEEKALLTHQLGDGLRELTMGEMSILCSNLAKGCEKQYLKEEQTLFTKLADYLKDRTPQVEGEGMESLAKLAVGDLEQGFPLAEARAVEELDRGAQRALVWSKKVTIMLASLLGRYEKEGSGFLEHTNVYVCDICGFIYVGDAPPDVCPVCKVPNWKMSKIERRPGV